MSASAVPHHAAIVVGRTRHPGAELGPTPCTSEHVGCFLFSSPLQLAFSFFPHQRVPGRVGDTVSAECYSGLRGDRGECPLTPRRVSAVSAEGLRRSPLTPRGRSTICTETGNNCLNANGRGGSTSLHAHGGIRRQSWSAHCARACQRQCRQSRVACVGAGQVHVHRNHRQLHPQLHGQRLWQLEQPASPTRDGVVPEAGWQAHA